MTADMGMAKVLSMCVWEIAANQHIRLSQIVNSQPDGHFSEPQVKELFGLTVSSVILKAYSAELLLKFMSFKKTGDFKRIHNLSDLYDDLDDDTKKLIADTAVQHGVAPVDQILANHKDDFIEWRYVFENPQKSVGFIDLDKAMEVLRAAEAQIPSAQT